MRFIGCKAALLEKIDEVLRENVRGEKQVFCDLFSGTGSVARHFKPRYRIDSNDLLHFSYILQKATVENNTLPDFKRLRENCISDPFKFLENSVITPGDGSQKWFALRNYSPFQGCTRRYLTCENAARIDFIRETLEVWWTRGLLTEQEYAYLLACLLEGIPSVSNITGTYGAYLKHWEKRALDPFRMARLEICGNGRKNRCFNQDANSLIGELEGDILYIDPPYNARQYIQNYHLLETISKGDTPCLSGITGMRPCAEGKSRYCSRRQVREAFEDLLARARFTDIIISYSTEGLMAAEEIEAILRRHGDPSSLRRYDVPYRKYKSKRPSGEYRLREYLFYIRKKG